MSGEELGEIWAQWSESEPMGSKGKKTREVAIETARALIERGYALVIVKPIKAWLQKPETPKAWFDQFDNEPAPLLVAKHRGGDDKRPLASGPWAPEAWTALLETDPVVLAAVRDGPKSVKEIGITVILAGHKPIRPATLRRHLRRLKCEVIGRSKKGEKDEDGNTILSVPLWGRKQ